MGVSPKQFALVLRLQLASWLAPPSGIPQKFDTLAAQIPPPRPRRRLSAAAIVFFLLNQKFLKKIFIVDFFLIEFF